METTKNWFALLAAAVGIDEPYQWQWDAYHRLVAGDVPGSVVVPTAAGKTMLIVAFVAALAAQASSRNGVSLPRRLVHVVNRRMLVDEATRLAQRISVALNTDPLLAEVKSALSSLSSGGRPLAVSAIRGGAADNGEWSLDPSTPAVVLATPDMLGSRLLFRGYGLGRSGAATHAGLLGCDTLIVHDEAHLAPAFTSLLRQVEELARAGAEIIGRPATRVIEMTATSGHQQTRPLICDVSADTQLRARMSAAKRLQLCGVEGEKPQALVLDALVTAALEHHGSNKAVAIFVSSPTMAGKVADRLIKGGVSAERILLLTGTLRGYERAQLSNALAFSRFDPGPNRQVEATAYFIATSAGEIGLDIDADVGLFDLSTLDRFIQRCGRVNRRGHVTGEITLVHAEGQELSAFLQERSAAALGILREAMGQKNTWDASPLALSHLSRHPSYAEAVDPPPAIRLLEKSVLTMLAMTSMRLDELGCPSPDVYIHGLVDEDAQVQLAWRYLPRAGSNFNQWMDAWPLNPTETARLPLEAAQKLLRHLFVIQRANATGDSPWALILDGQGQPTEAPAFHEGDQAYRWTNRLRPGQTVLLNQVLGGLNTQGQPSSDSNDPVNDVSAQVMAQAEGTPGACIVNVSVSFSYGEEGAVWRVVDQQQRDQASPSLEHSVNDDADAGVAALLAAETADVLLAKLLVDKEIIFHDAPRLTEAKAWRGVVRVWISDRAIRAADSGDLASLSLGNRGLQEHLDLTAAAACQIGNALDLQPGLRDVLIRAGAEHDRGKQWARWQRAIGHLDLENPLGKSGRTQFNFRANDGYRHELGSLVDLGSKVDGVASHLIATHHGWGRPTFRESALNKPGCRPVAVNVATDFDALGTVLGPWVVCHLEALMKAADVLAEVRADALLASRMPIAPVGSIAPWAPLPPPVAAASAHITVDVENFGEYLAGLGLAALLDRRGHRLAIGWSEGGMDLFGVDAEAITTALKWLCSAEVRPDETATRPAQADAAYPPLVLHAHGSDDWPLNHWMDEGLRSSSDWKLGAGQTSAVKTLKSLLEACGRSLKHPDFAVPMLMNFGGRKVAADASKFRFDAATNWSAQDAGFSLNESDSFKSTRPWVELLSALGLQFFFLPPADKTKRYFIWDGALSPTLALAAVKGLLPQCTLGFQPVIEPSGKMKDVFTSEPIHRERTSTCQSAIRVI
jgi:CRISPR-associated endonuclease/helicase Cas3